MNSALRTLAFVAFAASCSRAPRGGPCELDVRVFTDPEGDAAQLERAVESLRLRLESVDDDLEPRVRVGDASSLVIELAHQPDDPALEELRALIAHVPTFGVAMRVDDEALGATVEAEFARLEAWWSTHAAAPLEQFNRTPRGAGGPMPELEWVSMSAESYSKSKPPLERSWPCIKPPAEPAERLAALSAGDLASVEPDVTGEHSVEIELIWKPASAQELADIAAKYGRRTLCWTLDGEIIGTQLARETRDGFRMSVYADLDRRRTVLRALRSAIAAGARPARLEVVGLRSVR